MLPGVRPSISFALLPTASTLWVTLLIATIDGSETTMPRPRAKTSVFAVPRSIARSLENRLNIERKFIETDLKPPRIRSSLPAEDPRCSLSGGDSFPRLTLFQAPMYPFIDTSDNGYRTAHRLTAQSAP